MISTHWFTRFRHYLVSVMNVGLKKLSHTQALAYTQRKREGERSGYCWQYQSITLRLLLSVASTNYVSSLVYMHIHLDLSAIFISVDRPARLNW